MGRSYLPAACSAALLVFSGTAAFGQSVISAHSGLIHYVEGQVLLDDKAVEVKYSQFPEVRDNQVLKAGEGRAEVLLTPGVFLRLAENSSFRMVSNKLSDTRVEALSGAMIVESGEPAKDNQVTLLYKDRTISFLKSGLYRLDAENGLLRVYKGEARVTTADQSVVAKEAREIQLDAAAMTAMKFDPKMDDEFYRWAERRAGYIAMANVSAAKSLHDSGYASGYGSSVGTGLWSWNPWFGMFTYVPMGSSMWYSPYGYGFYSPYTIPRLYSNYPYYGSGYYPVSGGGGSAVKSGRYDPTTNYGIPSRPATSTHSAGSVASNSGSGRSFGGGSLAGGNSSGGFSGGASSGSSSAGPSVRSGGGGGSMGGGSTSTRGR